ncbi:MAG: alpha/beta fold hydrolase [Gammaproteobacteria bacterium]|nr:alpha/beta fold hydrolase [Gammaproteobacteria bacterium]MBT8104069.1 alpha/beta fold hydrolase [Gammaproteobacteria bacterium]NNK24084.1 S9 family peptidase [Woeseiaceae bacterium]
MLGIVLAATSAGAEVVRTTTNNGNLVMEDVPPIPAMLVDTLNRYQNVRWANLSDWTEDGQGIYIATRFGDLSQVHRVDMPGGARHQLSFFSEPVYGVSRQPGGSQLIFTRDAGGNEFSQVFLLDPASGDARMLTDGESRNRGVVWDRQGQRIAYQSTRRNGASNDVWIMDPAEPGKARVALESPDGTLWAPVEFSERGRQLLAVNYVSITDARSYAVDLDSGQATLLAGGAEDPSYSVPVAYDDDADGYWLITDQHGEFRQLAWQPLDPAAAPTAVTADIPWNVGGAAVSHDRRRMAFVVNEAGLSSVYLLDTRTRKHRKVAGLPTGTASGLAFSPDDRRLGMTLNTAQTPSDTFSLELGAQPLEYGELVRWTRSEVGGLDTSSFVAPELVHFPTFDEVDGAPREIPAWVYKPPGKGPFPVIVSIHGGPEGQARPRFSSTYQLWLKELGAAIVVPNVRGSAGYGKTYVSLDNGFNREDSVRDIGALLEWLDTRSDLDAGRVAVFGGSYGGYMVLASAVHFSDRLRAAVDIVGISSFVTFLENTQDYRRDLRRVEYGDERDPAMRAHLEKISPLNNVEKIDIPMFVVQGQNDPRVPVTEAEQIVAALRNQGQKVWYMNALNEGHGYRRKENRDIYQQATVMFLREHLLGQ